MSHDSNWKWSHPLQQGSTESDFANLLNLVFTRKRLFCVNFVFFISFCFNLYFFCLTLNFLFFCKSNVIPLSICKKWPEHFCEKSNFSQRANRTQCVPASVFNLDTISPNVGRAFGFSSQQLTISSHLAKRQKGIIILKWCFDWCWVIKEYF